jgi:hypothetical protein
MRKMISTMILALGMIVFSGGLDFYGNAHARDNNMGGITQDMQNMPRMRGTTHKDRKAAAKRLHESTKAAKAKHAHTHKAAGGQ